jgi:hypothetical protein
MSRVPPPLQQRQEVQVLLRHAKPLTAGNKLKSAAIFHSTMRSIHV